ncbi:MAG: septum formation initiator family protein [Bacteroidota bacterium]
MGYEKQNISKIFAANAMAKYEQTTSPISIPKIREARDMVYNGTTNPLNDETVPVNTLQAPRDKKHKRRRVSPFTIVLLLLGGAVSSVLYIGNILAVGHLMVQINLLQTKHQQILNEQELLKAQINRLSGLERIQQLAHDQLGLQNPRQLPVWIEIDPERINEVEEVFQQQMDLKR